MTFEGLKGIALIIFIFCKMFCLTQPEKISMNQRTLKKIPNYNKLMRPIENQLEVMNISIRVEINSIISLEPKSQVLTVKLWLALNWTDAFLAFNSTELGVKYMTGNTQAMWIPDLLVYNSLNEDMSAILETWSPAVIYPDGKIVWVPPFISRTLCLFKVRYFPFDTQNCSIKIGTWVSDITQIQLLLWDNASVLDQTLTQNNEWEVKSVFCQKNIIYGEGVVEGNQYDSILCHIILKRRPEFYTFSLVAPNLILLAIGSFTFLLPVTSGEKVSLAVTILLAMSVYVLVLMESLPPTADGSPFLGKFFLACTILLSLSTAMAVSVTNLVARDSCPPEALQKILKCFSHKKDKPSKTIEKSEESMSESVKDEEQETSQNDQNSLDWQALANVLDKFYFIVYVIAFCAISFLFLYVQGTT